jgi:hypothetical protein
LIDIGLEGPIAQMQSARPMVGSAEYQAIQLDPCEVAFEDAISKHALARTMGWIGPEIAGTTHGAVAVLYVFSFETPFSRHRLEPPFDPDFPLFSFENANSILPLRPLALL